MTDAEKKALINKLGAKNNKAFDPRYSTDNRKWFVGKIIDSLLSQSVADSNIEQKTKDIITASGTALTARIKKGFSSGTLANKWSIYNQITSRTQIIYGMIAIYPTFLDAANADYFDFILERRFRAIQRMAFYVNPNNVRNVFAYPSSKCGDIMKVNADAQSFWSGVNSGTQPFILSASGKSDPQKADENLFKTNKDCDRNLLACDPVATVLHMDALRVAKAPDKLLQALIAVGDHYLEIDNPLGHFGNFPDGQRLVAVTAAPVIAGTNVEIAVGKVGRILTFSKDQLDAAKLTTDAYIPIKGTLFMIVLGDVHESFLIDGVNPVAKKMKVGRLANSYETGAKVYAVQKNLPVYKTLAFHFTTDSRPNNALFEQLSIKSADLQVGDHAYVINHPLYLLYYPTGAWGGEHSFIAEIDSRDTTSTTFRNTLKVEGHGLSNTLLGMGAEMLEWINTVLSVLQVLTRIHLDNLKTNGRKTTTKVNFITRAESGKNMDVFEYNVPYTYKLFKGGKKTDTKIKGGFVIKEVDGDPTVFQIFNANDKDSTAVPKAPQPDVFIGVAFIGATFSTDQFKPSNWGVQYFNSQTASLESQPLFAKDNKTPKLLTFDDLAKSKPFFVTDDNGDAYVTRPRVDFSAGYQTFLKKNGAI